MAKRWLAQITLGELMVAVAIVGLLAATVLPMFLRDRPAPSAGEAAAQPLPPGP